MGVLDELALLPVGGPIRLVVWIAEKIADQADQQLYGEEALRGQLLELELQYDLDQITEEEYLEAEAVLLERMQIAAERTAEAEAEET